MSKSKQRVHKNPRMTKEELEQVKKGELKLEDRLSQLRGISAGINNIWVDDIRWFIHPVRLDYEEEARQKRDEKNDKHPDNSKFFYKVEDMKARPELRQLKSQYIGKKIIREQLKEYLSEENITKDLVDFIYRKDDFLYEARVSQALHLENRYLFGDKIADITKIIKNIKAIAKNPENVKKQLRFEFSKKFVDELAQYLANASPKQIEEKRKELEKEKDSLEKDDEETEKKIKSLNNTIDNLEKHSQFFIDYLSNADRNVYADSTMSPEEINQQIGKIQAYKQMLIEYADAFDGEVSQDFSKTLISVYDAKLRELSDVLDKQEDSGKNKNPKKQHPLEIIDEIKKEQGESETEPKDMDELLSRVEETCGLKEIPGLHASKIIDAVRLIYGAYQNGVKAEEAVSYVLEDIKFPEQEIPALKALVKGVYNVLEEQEDLLAPPINYKDATKDNEQPNQEQNNPEPQDQIPGDGAFDDTLEERTRPGIGVFGTEVDYEARDREIAGMLERARQLKKDLKYDEATALAVEAFSMDILNDEAHKLAGELAGAYNPRLHRRETEEAASSFFNLEKARNKAIISRDLTEGLEAIGNFDYRGAQKKFQSLKDKSKYGSHLYRVAEGGLRDAAIEAQMVALERTGNYKAAFNLLADELESEFTKHTTGTGFDYSYMIRTHGTTPLHEAERMVGLFKSLFAYAEANLEDDENTMNRVEVLRSTIQGIRELDEHIMMQRIQQNPMSQPQNAHYNALRAAYATMPEQEQNNT